MTDRIEGQVAAILSADSLVINRGSNRGVEVGMRFRVLNGRGIKVVDPETGETLGDTGVGKAEVKVISVKEKLAVARTFRTYSGGIADVMPFRTVRETMNVDPSVAEEATVQVGDPVVQVFETSA